MNSPHSPGSAQHDLEGRSVRDVVEYSPGQVNEAWCRKILRKMLQSLELQYAMQMPHRGITPDTIVFHANGEPLLISDDIDAAPAPDAHQADDLTALARVIHYAITQELAPTGPLEGRVAGYSASLVATVDACMDPDPARRPQSFRAARDMLGIVAPVAPASAVSLPEVPRAPVPDRDAAVAPHQTGQRHGRRWAIAAGGSAIALALVWFTGWHDAGAPDHIVLMQAQTSDRADANLAATGAAATATADDPAGSAVGDKAKDLSGALPTKLASNPADNPASGTSSGGTTSSGGGVDQPDSVAATVPQTVPARAAAVPRANRKAAAVARTAVPPGAVAGHASYQLHIKPWGVVYVDGVDRGVSPPLTRLALMPGRHTIRITNPKYRDSILEFESERTTSIGKIVVEFDRDTP